MGNIDPNDLRPTLHLLQQALYANVTVYKWPCSKSIKIVGHPVGTNEREISAAGPTLVDALGRYFAKVDKARRFKQAVDQFEKDNPL